jgi:hypothetical protein
VSAAQLLVLVRRVVAFLVLKLPSQNARSSLNSPGLLVGLASFGLATHLAPMELDWGKTELSDHPQDTLIFPHGVHIGPLISDHMFASLGLQFSANIHKVFV